MTNIRTSERKGFNKTEVKKYIEKFYDRIYNRLEKQRELQEYRNGNLQQSRYVP